MAENSWLVWKMLSVQRRQWKWQRSEGRRGKASGKGLGGEDHCGKIPAVGVGVGGSREVLCILYYIICVLYVIADQLGWPNE